MIKKTTIIALLGVKWRSICTKFLPAVAKEILIHNISTKSGC